MQAWKRTYAGATTRFEASLKALHTRTLDAQTAVPLRYDRCEGSPAGRERSLSSVALALLACLTFIELGAPLSARDDYAISADW